MRAASRLTLPTAGLLAGCAITAASAGERLLDSWRNDDVEIRQDAIIPALESSHPAITVKFQPTAPRERSSVLKAKVGGGTAGDPITCRCCDPALQPFQPANLEPLRVLARRSDCPGRESYLHLDLGGGGQRAVEPGVAHRLDAASRRRLAA